MESSDDAINLPPLPPLASPADLTVAAIELRERAEWMDPPGELAPALRRAAAFLEVAAERERRREVRP